MKNLIVLTAALGLGASMSGCGRYCKSARMNVIEPTNTVAAYLATHPDADSLAGPGCTLILQQFQRIPEGASTIRSIADNRFSHTESHCLEWRDSVRWVCDYYGGGGYWGHHGHWGRRNCYPESYSYCVAWQYDVVREPGYAEAMDLSKDLDLMFDKAHATCGYAELGQKEQALQASQDLLQYLTVQVQPENEKVYSMACGN